MSKPLGPYSKCNHEIKKFHGNATGLEVVAAKALFANNKKDDKCKFIYATYVGDGDSAVGWEVLADPRVKKEECQYHYRKACKRGFNKCFHNSVAMIPKKQTWCKKTKKWNKQT